MENAVSLLIVLLMVLVSFSCTKKEVCLQCTTIVSGVETVQPETCDTDEDVLDEQQAEYEQLVAAFKNDGWDASVNCIRQ